MPMNPSHVAGSRPALIFACALTICCLRSTVALSELLSCNGIPSWDCPSAPAVAVPAPFAVRVHLAPTAEQIDAAINSNAVFHAEGGQVGAVRLQRVAGEESPAAANSAAASRSVTRPDTPSHRMKIPFPPLTGGCHHLVGSQWRDIPCATADELKKRPPLAISVPSISAEVPAQGQPPATPIVWGSVAVGITSDPAQATEKDTMYGANAFSIQANTNFFPCTTCVAKFPFPNSKAGDLGFVQFTVQARPADVTEGSYTTLCISQWDHTANASIDYCSIDPRLGFAGVRGVLTGKHAFIGAAEVIGYYKCPNDTRTGTGFLPPTCLHLVAYLPWAGDWFSVDAPDALGLSTDGQLGNLNWGNLNGTIYGYGSGSYANFTNVEVETNLVAYNCILSPQNASGYFAVPCPIGNFPVNFTDLVDYTAEGNNLTITTGPTSGPANPVAEGWLSYRASR
jgi:hypothetical protein